MRFLSIMVISMTGQHVDQPFLNHLVQYAAVRVTVVVPCYNEEKRLDVGAFRGHFVPGHEVSFLFVNDGSRDGTLPLLRGANFDVLDLERNSGKAEAVRRGIVAAMERGADVVGFWDA